MDLWDEEASQITIRNTVHLKIAIRSSDLVSFLFVLDYEQAIDLGNYHIYPLVGRLLSTQTRRHIVLPSSPSCTLLRTKRELKRATIQEEIMR